MTAAGWQSWITFAVAVLGAVLGIINTWQGLRRDNVRLRVRPLSVVALANGAEGFGIEVVNLSTFAVTIEEVGFTLDGRSAAKGDRAPILRPFFLDHGSWPRRLEPRQAVTAYFDVSGISTIRKRIHRAYAKTACREYAYGVTPALQALREQ